MAVRAAEAAIWTVTEVPENPELGAVNETVIRAYVTATDDSLLNGVVEFAANVTVAVPLPAGKVNVTNQAFPVPCRKFESVPASVDRSDKAKFVTATGGLIVTVTSAPE